MNLICKILFILIILIKSVNADNLVNDNQVKISTESKYEFHNQFGEYLEILQNQH